MSSRATAVTTMLRELFRAASRLNLEQQAQLGCPGSRDGGGVAALLALLERLAGHWGGAGRTRRTRRAGQRRWVLLVLVIAPLRVRSPLEYSEGTSPQNPMSDVALGKRRQSQTSADKVSALEQLGDPPIGAQPSHRVGELPPSQVALQVGLDRRSRGRRARRRPRGSAQ